MFNSADYIGIPYDTGRNDCYGLVRRYYAQEWGLRLPNLARPEEFWEDPHLNILESYRKMGFKVVMEEDPQIGDGLMMPLWAAMNTHTAVVCGDNQVLHHLPGRLSSVDRLRPLWLNRTTVILRHPLVAEARRKQQKIQHFHEVSYAPVFRTPALQAKIEAQLGSTD